MIFDKLFRYVALFVVVAAVPAMQASASTGLVRYASSAGCDDSWTNVSGGAWETGSNWSNDSPPTALQHACITIALSAPVVVHGSAAVGGFTLGGSGGTTELDFHGSQVLTVNGNSTIGDNGILTNDNSAFKIIQTGTLTNDGLLEPAGADLEFVGNLDNEADGLILVAPGSDFFFDGPGTFTNKGDFSLPAGANFAAPHAGGIGVTFINAGIVQNDTGPGDGTFTISTGATVKETTGATVGAAPVINSTAIVLAGPGASRYELTGATSISGTIAASQTLLLDSGGITTVGSLTNNGTITGIFGSAKVTVPNGDALTNKGTILVPPGLGLVMDGNLDNSSTGRIDLASNGGYSGVLQMNGNYTLTNHGTISIAYTATLSTSGPTGSTGTINNEGGTIQNDGMISVPSGGTFIEGNGATNGRPVFVTGGQLDLQGTGASQFAVSGAISGDIAPHQVVAAGGMHAAASFTNNGTLISGGVVMPAGDTLTNKGTLSVDRGGMLMTGNLDNASGGVIGVQGPVTLIEANTEFTNEGTLYLLFSGGQVGLGGCDCGPDNNQFINTGNIYVGMQPDSVQWGGVTLSSSIGEANSETVSLGGTMIPVPVGEPPSPPLSPATMTYGLTGSPGNPPNWTLTCPGSAADGWSLDCTGYAKLVDPSNNSPTPTVISVTGSGTAVTSGWASTYGQTVQLKATITPQSGPAPTGTVTFFSHIQPAAGTNPAQVVGDVLGSAPVTTTGSITTATLTINNLQPGQYQFEALYSGDSNDLPASSSYSPYINQNVSQSSTTTTLSSSGLSVAFGRILTFTAHVVPALYGANPTGSVFFTAGNVPLGSAPVTTSKGKTTATIRTSSLLVGNSSVGASYGGDYNYTNSNSAARTETVTAVTVPTSLKVVGPAHVSAGSTYQATAESRGPGHLFFGLTVSSDPPKKLAIDPITGHLTFKVPAQGLKNFSFTVVVSNAAGRENGTKVKVSVRK